MSDQTSKAKDSDRPSRRGASQLTTARLTLRPPRLQDAPAVVALLDNRKIAAMTAHIPYPYALADAEEWIGSIDHRDGDEQIFFLFANKDGKEVLVGACGTMTVDATTRELGYWLGEPFWGQGYASEAARAVVARSLATPRVARIDANCQTRNIASRRVLEKTGFVLTGEGICSSRVAGDNLPAFFFSLTRAAWTKQPGALATLFADRTGVWWGLRGDPPLWQAIEDRFDSEPLPASPDALRAVIEEAFLALTGSPIDSEEHIYVEAFERGGMSSGLVSPKFWRETALPLLTERWRDAMGQAD